MSSFISNKAQKRDSSSIHGRGLFAIENISKGEIVSIKGGHILTSEQLHNSQSKLHVEMQIADNFFIAPIDEAGFEPSMMCLNHSCDGNLGILGNIVFVAIRNIETGEELTIDYALMDNNSTKFRCLCGAKCCRMEVTGLDWKIPEVQQKYAGYFSAYVARLINNN